SPVGKPRPRFERCGSGEFQARQIRSENAKAVTSDERAQQIITFGIFSGNCMANGIRMRIGNLAKPVVGILMGSDTDWPTMKAAGDACAEFGVKHEVHVISAHRTPGDLSRYASGAHKRGLRVIIAGAGGAAHLPGVTAAL